LSVASLNFQADTTMISQIKKIKQIISFRHECPA
jgi:hypothetical protein